MFCHVHISDYPLSISFYPGIPNTLDIYMLNVESSDLLDSFVFHAREILLSNNLLSKHLNEFARTQKAKELVANNSIEGIAEKDCATQCREYIKSPHYRRRLFIERDVDTRREGEESGRVSRRPAERIQELVYVK